MPPYTFDIEPPNQSLVAPLLAALSYPYTATTISVFNLRNYRRNKYFLAIGTVLFCTTTNFIFVIHQSHQVLTRVQFSGALSDFQCPFS